MNSTKNPWTDGSLKFPLRFDPLYFEHQVRARDNSRLLRWGSFVCSSVFCSCIVPCATKDEWRGMWFAVCEQRHVVYTRWKWNVSREVFLFCLSIHLNVNQRQICSRFNGHKMWCIPFGMTLKMWFHFVLWCKWERVCCVCVIWPIYGNVLLKFQC